MNTKKIGEYRTLLNQSKIKVQMKLFLALAIFIVCISCSFEQASVMFHPKTDTISVLTKGFGIVRISLKEIENGKEDSVRTSVSFLRPKSSVNLLDPIPDSRSGKRFEDVIKKDSVNVYILLKPINSEGMVKIVQFVKVANENNNEQIFESKI